MYPIFRLTGRRRAFTLVELIITLALVSILVGAIWVMFTGGFSTFFSQLTRTGVKSEAGRALIRIAEELRAASSLSSAQQASVTFAVDTDDNGIAEAVQYVWSGTTGTAFNRISGSTTPMVSSISALSFSYYDANNDLLSFPVTASQVKLVALDLTASEGDESFHVYTKIRLRSL